MKKRATITRSESTGIAGPRFKGEDSREQSPEESTRVPQPALKDSKALVVGIANASSIAYGCAKAFHELGADVAITYLNDKAKPYVEPLAREVKARLFLPLDFAQPGMLESVFEQITQTWGRLNILVHSAAFAPKEDLQGGLLNCSAEGFAKAMDISCHSFIRMARLAAPLMKNGGTMFTMTYHGAHKVISNYNVMGPVKAALECACRYLAYELGDKKIRVHAISPGPLKTRASSGLKDFDRLLADAEEQDQRGQQCRLGDRPQQLDDGLSSCLTCVRSPSLRKLSGYNNRAADISMPMDARIRLNAPHAASRLPRAVQRT